MITKFLFKKDATKASATSHGELARLRLPSLLRLSASILSCRLVLKKVETEKSKGSHFDWS